MAGKGNQEFHTFSDCSNKLMDDSKMCGHLAVLIVHSQDCVFGD